MWTEKTITEFWRNNEAGFAGDMMASGIIRLSRKYINGKCLDVGAGSGALMGKLLDASGVDIVPRHPSIVQGNMAKLPYEDESFATVFAVNLLEHLDDEMLRNGIVEVGRVLKTGGYFVVTVPYKEKLSDNLVWCPNCHAKFHRWGHLRAFDEVEIGKLFCSNRFHIVDIKILPIGVVARYPFMRYCWKPFARVSVIKTVDMFVVGERL